MTDTATEAPDARLDQLVAALRAQIPDSGELPPERVLCDQLQVTRHLLRKALRVLREAGEIRETRSGRRAAGGTGAVSALSPKRMVQSTNPFEVMEMRLMIEPSLARLAALRASPDEIAKIVEAASSAPHMTPSEADQAFHRAIAAGARNSLASELNFLLHCVQTDARLRFTDSDADARTTEARVRDRDAAHRAIAEAIAARDPAGAAEAMRAHLSAMQAKLMGRLGLTGFEPG
ncbi:FadR/GntR family transcriptional regulator [Paenirhodobacter populi]|uniref:FadR family transcriptional regulator n=1 Tax=Paenirhodobacter populi TaxID=2306993 RepID=A0A443JNU5_9RHOB|nr:FCD domain-containing protein [Sinirhodobacter populi]RWR22129.1 FadR family transcriptional regulator [Sinirhodobacter populi]